MRPFETLVTIATPDWSCAVAVMVDGLARHAADLAEEIVVYRPAPLADEEWCMKRDPRVVFRPMDCLRPAKWPKAWGEPSKLDKICLYKWALMADPPSRSIIWMDSDVLIRGDINPIAEMWSPGTVLLPPAMTVHGWNQHNGKRAMSTGIVCYEPDRALLKAVTDYAETIKRPQYAADQTTVSMWLRSDRDGGPSVLELPCHYHANTRARLYQPEIWAEVGGDGAALWHYAGPKPWSEEAESGRMDP